MRWFHRREWRYNWRASFSARRRSPERSLWASFLEWYA